MITDSARGLHFYETSFTRLLTQPFKFTLPPGLVRHMCDGSLALEACTVIGRYVVAGVEMFFASEEAFA